MSRDSGRVGSRALLLALAALVVMLAGWWLLRGDAPARDDVAVLGRPAAAPPADAARPGLQAPAAGATPIAFGRAAERLDADLAPDVAADAAPLALTLRHHDGAPATGVTALLCVGSNIVEKQVTDAAGSARFAPLAGAATLIVGGASDVPLLLPLATASGSQQLTLPAGLVIAGQVLVDGARPVRPFLLALVAMPEERQVTLPVDDWALSAAVPGLAQQPLQNAQLVGLDGRFRFSALPASWQGRFDIGWQFVAAGKADSLSVQAPAPDVLLDIASTLTVHGRVVDVGGGVPVPGALIEFTLAGDDGGSFAFGFSAGPDGRFAIPAAWHAKALGGLQLALRHPDGPGYREVSYTAEELARSTDLGDIELLDTRAVAFVVLDAEGAPVPGAIAVADDPSATRSRPADAQGRGTLGGMPRETESMTVWAHRFFEQRVPLPPAGLPADEEHPVEVVLERSPTLDVFVSGPGGVPLRDLQVVITGEQKVFSGSDDPNGSSFIPDPVLYAAGMSTGQGLSSHSSRDAAGRRVLSGAVVFPVPLDGHVSISNLLPDVPFDVAVQGELGGLAWGVETLSLRPGEAREVAVVMARAPLGLTVRVIDPQGRPVPAVAVRPQWPGKPPGGLQLETNAEGLWSALSVYADPLTLELSRQGHASRTVDVAIVERHGLPFDVVLQPGLEVAVLVRDASGRTVAADSVDAELDGRGVGRSALAAGAMPGASIIRGARGDPPPAGVRWRIADLPAATVTLVARIGGRTYSQLHDARVPDAEIVVPAVGALRVLVSFPVDASQPYWLEVLASGAAAGQGEHETHGEWVQGWELGSGELLLPALVPGDYSITLYRLGEGPRVPCSREAKARVLADETVSIELLPP